MARSSNVHSTDLPAVLWDRLDQLAKRQGMPTSQLIATWLWEELNRRSRVPGDQAEGLALDDHPYRMAVRSYPRRDRDRELPATIDDYSDDQLEPERRAEHQRYLEGRSEDPFSNPLLGGNHP